MTEDMASQGRRAGQRAQHSDALKTGARVGLVAYGVVHLLIALIAVQIAWSGGGDASSGGALRTLADRPFGRTMLVVVAVGLTALAVWQLMTSAWGYRSESDTRKRMFKRVVSGGRTVIYAVLAFSAARQALGSSSSSGSDSKEEGLTASLLAVPAGRILVVAIGIGILAVGASLVWKGATDRFTHDLTIGSSGTYGSAVFAVGRAGYIAKGVAIAIVGALFAQAAITYDADKAGGLDDALTTLKQQPFGPYLLTIVALGLAAFGVFCFAWARHVRAR